MQRLLLLLVLVTLLSAVAYSPKISRLKSLKVSVYYYVLSDTFKAILHNKLWEINL
jgi:hypothetical protein